MYDSWIVARAGKKPIHSLLEASTEKYVRKTKHEEPFPDEDEYHGVC